MAQSHHTGKKGEELARQHLIKQGYTIRTNNWRYRKFEVDIIAQIGNDLVFVEVKTRSNTYAGHPSEFVSPTQQRQIIEAANAYIERFELDMEARFDVIAIVDGGLQQHIEHIEDAFFPSI